MRAGMQWRQELLQAGGCWEAGLEARTGSVAGGPQVSCSGSAMASISWVGLMCMCTGMQVHPSCVDCCGRPVWCTLNTTRHFILHGWPPIPALGWGVYTHVHVTLAVTVGLLVLSAALCGMQHSLTDA